LHPILPKFPSIANDDSPASWRGALACGQRRRCGSGETRRQGDLLRFRAACRAWRQCSCSADVAQLSCGSLDR
jgi:hypothetical protein